MSFQWESLLTLGCQNVNPLESSALTASKMTCRDSDNQRCGFENSSTNNIYFFVDGF